MFTHPSRRTGTARGAALLGIAVLGSIASAQTPPPLHFYVLKPTFLGPNQTTPIASNFGLTEELSPTGAPLPVWTMADGSVRQVFGQRGLEVVPDLRKAGGVAPELPAVQRFADAFIAQFGLKPDDVSTYAPLDSSLWTMQANTPTAAGTPVTPFRSLRYQRMLDGLPVFGPSSDMCFTANSQGIIAVLIGLLRPVQALQVQPRLKLPYQIQQEYAMHLHVMVALSPGTPKLVSTTHCYLEQGLNYCQPAYRYRVQITGQAGDVSTEEFYVLEASNALEPLAGHCYDGFEPVPPSNTPAPAIEPALSSSTVRIGQYVVRQDSDPGICLNVVNAFNSNAGFGSSIIGRSAVRTQYYWDYLWLWEAALGYGDNSQYYPGAVDYATVVGHSAPWLFTCLSNYGEVMDLRNMDHYGKNSPSGNPSHDYTSYLLVASCSMMPAPGDPYGGSYASPAGPFDVYWNIFWGLHGMYGFRTTAGKSSAVTAFGSMGIAEGVGCSNVSSWMNSTAGLDHSGGWNYGTAVLPSGREGDTMYNLEALPRPGSLTMWWNHS